MVAGDQLGLFQSVRTPVAKVLSYGGGLDSFAMLVDAIARGELPDVVVFVDVSDGDEIRHGVDPGEWPSTYRHIREVAMPLCARYGIEFVWVDSTRYPVRDARSLFAWLFNRRQIPVAGPGRVCTPVAKVERFERWMDDRFPGLAVEVWIGYERGEEARAASDPNKGKRRKPRADRAERVNRFPLMERGLCRCRCESLVRAAGFPVPRKSACLLCPYSSKGDWQRFARELPAQFARVVELEERKPPTAKNGRKLSIMGYRTIKDPVTKEVIAIRNPMLPVFIQGGYKPKATPCIVCGAEQRATKATGCDYLEAPAA